MKTVLISAVSLFLLASAIVQESHADEIPRGQGPKVNYETVQKEDVKTLRYRKIQDGYLLVLRPGQEVIQSLKDFQIKKKIKLASVTGVGDVEQTHFSHYNTTTKEMDPAPVVPDSNELTSLVCTLAIVSTDGSSFPHCHVNIGLSGAQDNRVVGGHLTSSIVSVIVELMIHVFPESVTKVMDPYFHGDLFDLNDFDILK